MLESKQQTAVEWFANELLSNDEIPYRIKQLIKLDLEQAKAMEKEQKCLAYDAHKKQPLSYNEDGSVTVRYIPFEEWYEKTFGKQ